MNIEEKLAERGLQMPDAGKSLANYVPYVRAGGLLFVSGQLPFRGAELIAGRLGDGLNVEQGQEAARLCAVGLLMQVKAACDGDLSRLNRVVKLTAFVNSTPDFIDQPLVVNGASDLLVELLGENGRHSRSAVGVAVLPRGASVEIEGIFDIQ